MIFVSQVLLKTQVTSKTHECSPNFTSTFTYIYRLQIHCSRCRCVYNSHCVMKTFSHMYLPTEVLLSTCKLFTSNYRNKPIDCPHV